MQHKKLYRKRIKNIIQQLFHTCSCFLNVPKKQAWYKRGLVLYKLYRIYITLFFRSKYNKVIIHITSSIAINWCNAPNNKSPLDWVDFNTAKIPSTSCRVTKTKSLNRSLPNNQFFLTTPALKYQTVININNT
mgnify:CR=1 FL=1